VIYAVKGSITAFATAQHVIATCCVARTWFAQFCCFSPLFPVCARSRESLCSTYMARLGLAQFPSRRVCTFTGVAV